MSCLDYFYIKEYYFSRQKHFALLNRVVDSQFRKIILIGLLNIIIIGVFVAALFFLHFLNHKDPHTNDKERSTTVLPTELPPSTVPAFLKYICADGFDLVFGKCRQINIDLPVHQEAERRCNARGSTLFTIKSELVSTKINILRAQILREILGGSSIPKLDEPPPS